MDTPPTYVPAVYPGSLHPPTMVQLKDSLLATAASNLIQKSVTQILQQANNNSTPAVAAANPFKMDLKQALEALAQQVYNLDLEFSSIQIIAIDKWS